MAKSKTMRMQWPAAGVVRRNGLFNVAQQDGPYPAVWAANVRLQDTLTERLRGGSFTGRSYSSPYTYRYVNLVTENDDEITTENGDSIVLGPQYEVPSGDGTMWVTPGSDAPTAGTADCSYRARMLRVDGHIIMCSRVGDPTDWDYGADVEDVGRAVPFQLSEADEVGDDVIALVPHRDAFLLGFTASETWVLKGDPTTGTLQNVSREVGIVTARAWCKNHDTVYFLSSRGLYSVQADGSGLQALSEEVLPVELSVITNTYCMLEYSHEDRGVYIILP